MSKANSYNVYPHPFQTVAKVSRPLMLGIVSVCYICSAFIVGIFMVIEHPLTYHYDNGYYSCIANFENRTANAAVEEGCAR